MLRLLSDLYYRMPQRAQNLFTNQWYEHISLLDRDADMIFMNYGWASLGPGLQPLPLGLEDEPNRYCIQMYHRVAGAVDLRGKDVLEVGCGRGGGASYIARCLSARSMTGLDLAANAIAFCRRYHTVPGLSFVQGSAENLQFAPQTFDAVVNVESSHCYNRIDQFFTGVYRVLKPGGYFLYTDHREQKDLEKLRQQILAPGFVLLEEENINANVVRALELDNARKQALIHQKIPTFLHSFFNEFAGMQGTRSSYATIRSGERVYLRFVLQKPING